MKWSVLGSSVQVSINYRSVSSDQLENEVQIPFWFWYGLITL